MFSDTRTYSVTKRLKTIRRGTYRRSPCDYPFYQCRRIYQQRQTRDLPYYHHHRWNNSTEITIGHLGVCVAHPDCCNRKHSQYYRLCYGPCNQHHGQRYKHNINAAGSKLSCLVKQHRQGPPHQHHHHPRQHAAAYTAPSPPHLAGPDEPVTA